MSFEELAAKPNRRYRNIVLSGGGILAIAHVGAIIEAAERGLLGDLTHFAGSSAGSILAAVLACRAPIELIREEFMADFGAFGGGGLRGLINCFYSYGENDGAALLKWFEAILYKVCGDPDITFGEAFARFGTDLYITGTALGARKMVVFHHDEYPEMTIKCALRISTSMPGAFVPVSWAGDLWVDGGVINNYPICVFHRDSADDDVLRPLTLGLLLVNESGGSQISGWKTYIEGLVECLLKAQKIDEQDSLHTVRIPCGGVSSTDFTLSVDRRELLIAAGRAAMRNFLSIKNN